MRKVYHHPLDVGFSEKIHTPAGVRSLVEKSHLMALLRELEQDGHDVSGASAELVALVNYVSSSQISLSDLSTHLDYCAELVKRQTR